MDLRLVYILAVLGLVHCELVNLNCKAKKKFVDGHNSRREQVANGTLRGQPAASKMNLLVWHEELAAKARKWAARNTFEHNPDNTIPSGEFTTGENLYEWSSSRRRGRLEPRDALEAWFLEHRDYRYKPIEEADFYGGGPQVGHYTQMMWSDSTYVGCAVSNFLRDGMNVFLVVCNYGPAGNIIGERPYESGKPAGRLSCGGGGGCSRRYGDSC